MHYMGLATDLLDTRLVHNQKSMSLVQIKYTHDLVRSLGLKNCRPIDIVDLGPYYLCKSHRGPKPKVWQDPGISRLQVSTSEVALSFMF